MNNSTFLKLLNIFALLVLLLSFSTIVVGDSGSNILVFQGTEYIDSFSQELSSLCNSKVEVGKSLITNSESKPDTIIIAPRNDVVLSSIKQSIKKLIAEAKPLNSRIILVSPNKNKDLDLFINSLDVDFKVFTSENFKKEFLSNNLLNAQGERFFAQKIFETIGDSDTEGYVVCKGGEMSKLETISSFKSCSKYSNLINEYALKYGVYEKGIDLLMLLTIVQGESSCMSAEELKTAGKATAAGGLFQVDYPCLRKEGSCPTLDSEVDEGIKHISNILEEFAEKGITGTVATNLLLLQYNRGKGVTTKAIEFLQAGDDLVSATDKACSYYYGHENGLPGELSCTEGMRCSGDKVNDYKFYCGDKTVGEVHYASKRINTYTEVCKAIGGIPEVGEVYSSSSSSGFMFGINKDVLAPYTVSPSIFTSSSSSLSLYVEGIDLTKQLDSCGSDIDCVKTLISSHPGWMFKYLGEVFPAENSWVPSCESSEEYYLNSVAEIFDMLPNALEEKCVAKVKVKNPDDSWLFKDKMRINSNSQGTSFTYDNLNAKSTNVLYYFSNDKLTLINEVIDKDFFYLVKNGSKYFIPAFKEQQKFFEYPECTYGQFLTKFCGVDISAVSWKYDIEKKEIVTQPSLVKFAYKLKSNQLRINDFKVQNLANYSNTLVVSWQKISTMNIPSYKIYYSPSSISNSLDSLNLNQFEVDTSREKVFESDTSEYICDEQNYCARYIEGEKMLKNTLYYFKDSNTYVYLFPAKDYQFLDFLIHPVKEGIDPILTRPTVLEISLDNLAPIPPVLTVTTDGTKRIINWDVKDVKNRDYSSATDLQHYTLYCKDSKDILSGAALSPPVVIESECSSFIVEPVDKEGNRLYK